MTIAKASHSRVFLIEGRARVDHNPKYESCMRMLGITHGLGDIERIECPDPYNYGKFVEVAQIRGEEERPSTSLEGRYTMDLLSTLMRFARVGCEFDVQLHLGQCTNPAEFDTFEKALVLEGASLTNYSTDDLGALASGDDTAVNETADISATRIYEVRRMNFREQAGSIITNELLDVVYCDTISCGECDEMSDGCEKVFALTEAAGGSPGTPADIVFTLDAGRTWFAHDVDTLGAAETPDALACVSSYLVVVSNASGSLHYALLSEFDGIQDPTFLEVATGFVVTGEPNDIWSLGQKAFVVGNGGYVYELTDPTAGVEVIDAGDATTENLNAVHAYSEDFAVAVGNNGAVIYTEDGNTWGAAPVLPGGGAHLLCVWVKSEREWWVGTSAGQVFVTLDQGASWSEVTFTNSGSGHIADIVFSTDSIGYIAHNRVHIALGNRGYVLRTYNAGNSWQILPEVGTMPANDLVNALAACWDANILVGVGLADDATDGILLYGSAA